MPPADHPQDKPNDIEVRIVPLEGEPVLGSIVRVTTDQVEIALLRRDLNSLDGVELATLTFRTTAGGELSTSAKRVTVTHVGSDRPRMHFRIVHPPQQPLLLDRGTEGVPDIGDPDNRRETFRVQPRTLMDVPVVLRPFGDPTTSLMRQLADIRRHGHRQVVRGSLFDISLGGAGVLVTDRESWAYGRGARVDLSLELPDRRDPLEVTGLVRRAQDVRIGMRYGIEFEPSPGRPHEQIERAVLEYVMGCQRDALRRRAS